MCVCVCVWVDVVNHVFSVEVSYDPVTSVEHGLYLSCSRLVILLCVCVQILSDEGRRKQYDAYGSAGFDAGQGGAQQQYWSGGGGGATGVDPEELFRKIFGEFSGGRGFGDIFGDNTIFDRQQEVSQCMEELTFDLN